MTWILKGIIIRLVWYIIIESIKKHAPNFTDQLSDYWFSYWLPDNWDPKGFYRRKEEGFVVVYKIENEVLDLDDNPAKVNPHKKAPPTIGRGSP